MSHHQWYLSNQMKCVHHYMHPRPNDNTKLNSITVMNFLLLWRFYTESLGSQAGILLWCYHCNKSSLVELLKITIYTSCIVFLGILQRHLQIVLWSFSLATIKSEVIIFYCKNPEWDVLDCHSRDVFCKYEIKNPMFHLHV